MPAILTQPTHSARWRALFGVLAGLWLCLCIAIACQPYCFEWDSAQYALGAQDFDISRHQPHPPGYPLWAKLTGFLGAAWNDYLRPQRWLALFFTTAAIALVWRVAIRWVNREAAPWIALLMACSPVVMLYSAVPLTYAVDLFASALAGYTMLRVWEGRYLYFVVGYIGLGITAGFRQSGVTFLLPMLGWMAVYAIRRGAVRQVIVGIVGGTTAIFLWYVPTALSMGGFGNLAAINHHQMTSSAALMSVFYGASWTSHAKMLVGLVLYSIFAFGIPVGLCLLWMRAQGGSKVGDSAALLPHWSFWLVWIAPNFLFNALVHNTKAGYLLLALPPLALLLSRRMPIRWLAFGAMLSLAVGYIPYPAVLGMVSSHPDVQRVAYHLMRCTPGVTYNVLSVQQALDRHIEGHRQQIRSGYLLTSFQEAPNLRTLSYDFPSVQWYDGRYHYPDRSETVWIVVPAYQMSSEWERRYPDAHKVWGEGRASLWLLPAAENNKDRP